VETKDVAVQAWVVGMSQGCQTPSSMLVDAQTGAGAAGGVSISGPGGGSGRGGARNGRQLRTASLGVQNPAGYVGLAPGDEIRLSAPGQVNNAANNAANKGGMGMGGSVTQAASVASARSRMMRTTSLSYESQTARAGGSSGFAAAGPNGMAPRPPSTSRQVTAGGLFNG
jgi:hypothetical protein